MQDANVLNLKNIKMSFGTSLALAGVSLSIRRGEVFGLLGQNGSGKSTLVKVLAGVHQPQAGSEINLRGEQLSFPLDPMLIKQRGIAFVHQHLGLVASLSVLENMRVAAPRKRNPWFVDWKKEATELSDLFAGFGLSIDPMSIVSDLEPVERAFVAIVRAFEELGQSRAGADNEGILVLDEPTPFLPAEDVEQLFDLVRDIARRGASVIIVTHDLDEVCAVTDRVAVLRDGKLVDVLNTKEAGRQAILDTIVGLRIDAFVRSERDTPKTSSPIRVAGLSRKGEEPFDLEIATGEILGVTGLIGSGFAAVPYLLYGATPAQGKIEIANQTVNLADQNPFSAQRSGLAFVPGDRLGAAGIGSLPVTDNITLPVLPHYWRSGRLRRQSMTEDAANLSKDYDVRPPRPQMRLGAFSGGNQQKVLLAKWIRTKPVLLMLDEPTQGVDFEARQQIFDALDQVASTGTAILCASTDNEQLAQICDRVIIFAHNRPVLELSGKDLTREAIAEACFNSNTAPDLTRSHHVQ